MDESALGEGCRIGAEAWMVDSWAADDTTQYQSARYSLNNALKRTKVVECRLGS